MRVPHLAAVLLACLAVLAAGCGDDAGGGAEPAGDKPLQVVATTTVVGDLAREVAGERAEVHSILRPNSDPHEYEPRPSDAEAVAEAALVVRSGGEIDDWLGDLVRNAGGEAETVDLGRVARLEGGDPHWWQDPRNAIRAVGRLREALADADPPGRAVYARNAAAYTRELRTVDAAVERCLRPVAPAERKLVTNHDALGYFARRYDLDVVATIIPSRTTSGQASAGRVADLVATVRREGVRTIFPERRLEPRLEEAIAREAGVEVGPPLYTDALSIDGRAGSTYAGMLAANARAIAEGLGAPECRLPEEIIQPR